MTADSTHDRPPVTAVGPAPISGPLGALERWRKLSRPHYVVMALLRSGAHVRSSRAVR